MNRIHSSELYKTLDSLDLTKQVAPLPVGLPDEILSLVQRLMPDQDRLLQMDARYSLCCVLAHYLYLLEDKER